MADRDLDLRYSARRWTARLRQHDCSPEPANGYQDSRSGYGEPTHLG